VRQLEIKAAAQSALNALDTVRTDQRPFATSLALNRVAQAALGQVRAGLRDEYRNHGGSLAFLMQGVRMYPATKMNPTAPVYDMDRFMAYQEEGGPKQATNATIWKRNLTRNAGGGLLTVPLTFE
jgi:hypothetical protein